jgi:scyllo-inositol 2-dehydrogenase (NADP+)
MTEDGDHLATRGGLAGRDPAVPHLPPPPIRGGVLVSQTEREPMDRESRPLNVALLGYGLGGAAFHAPLIDAVPGLRLAAIVTSNPERVEAARRAFPEADVVPSADAVWARAGDLDLAVVTTPNRTHVPLARAALDAGLAVVVDKPLAASAADGEALVAEAERKGRLLTVFQNRRWDGDFLTVRRLMEDGALGDVHRFESRFERWRPQPKEGWRERGDPAEGGGTLYDLGSHLVDQARVLFGPVTHVYAEVDRRRPGVEADDDSFVALTHASGVRSHLWMGAVSGDFEGRFRVLGSRAAYVKRGMDPQEAALRAGARAGDAGWGREAEPSWGRVGAGDTWTAVQTEPGAYPTFYARVEAALRGGGAPPVDPRDAVAVLRILEAARRSSETRTVVEMRDG